MPLYLHILLQPIVQLHTKVKLPTIVSGSNNTSSSHVHPSAMAWAHAWHKSCCINIEVGSMPNQATVVSIP